MTPAVGIHSRWADSPRWLHHSAAFGMTEASPVVTLGSPTKRGDYPGTCGVIVPNTEVKIISVEDGRELERGETGEICVRGPQVRATVYQIGSAARNVT